MDTTYVRRQAAPREAPRRSVSRQETTADLRDAGRKISCGVQLVQHSLSTAVVTAGSTKVFFIAASDPSRCITLPPCYPATLPDHPLHPVSTLTPPVTATTTYHALHDKHTTCYLSHEWLKNTTYVPITSNVNSKK
ncbi:hypothetical protein E2C01_042047 [Portunus trituberculatus]|uniref:Uncharacterized protein n=1 Tax=Portunus trituberculatus TaxID=210409 RepID=A0A5B7FTH9_PORTR|nr:hypothetical protein [Portunus trituberculatus]